MSFSCSLYLRLIARHPKRKAVAIGHAMRKLLHLAFAIWKSGRPFDPKHYRWEQPTHVAGSGEAASAPQQSEEEQAAGHKLVSDPAQPVVTAARGGSAGEGKETGEGVFVDFGQVKQQLSLERVLDQLGLTERLRGSGPQRRCACPIHRGDGRGRTFSVNLEENVFACHKASCGKQGDVIDLWSALHGMSLREAAFVNADPKVQRRAERKVQRS